MSCYAGITTNPERRKEEHKINYPNLYKWEQHPFSNRKLAQTWENQQVECHRDNGGREPDNPNAIWYGYKFYY